MSETAAPGSRLRPDRLSIDLIAFYPPNLSSLFRTFFVYSSSSFLSLSLSLLNNLINLLCSVTIQFIQAAVLGFNRRLWQDLKRKNLMI